RTRSGPVSDGRAGALPERLSVGGGQRGCPDAMFQPRALRRRRDGLARDGGRGRGRARPQSGVGLTRAAGGGPKPIVFSGGPILTMADPLHVDALTVEGDRIVWAGTLEDCRASAGIDREEHDLAGRTLMPGFVDAHCHPLMLGQTQSWVDIGPRIAPSIDALIAVLAE